jgi:hypothetical protein
MKYVEKVNGACVLHSPQHKMLAIMELRNPVVERLLQEVDTIAKMEACSKIFAMVPRWCAPRFVDHGFVVEATIPDFYKGKVACCCVSKFLQSDRQPDEQTVACSKSVVMPRMEPAENDIGGELDFVCVEPNSAKEIIYDLGINNLEANNLAKDYSYSEYAQKKYYVLRTQRENLGVAEVTENSIWENAFIHRILVTENDQDIDFSNMLHKLYGFLITKKVKTVYSYCNKDIAEAEKLYKNVGFKLAGRLRNHLIKNDEYSDLNIWYKTRKRSRKKVNLWSLR